MPKTPAPLPPDLDAQPGDGMDRVISLSDGIYAFAMTLLAVNVDLPRPAANAGIQEVTDAVVALGPQFFIYASSFLLVGLYWQISRRTFRLIARDDSVLTWITIIQLMFVAFLPVATGLFDTHPSVPIVVVVYAGTLLCIGISGQVLWWHAQRAHLFEPNVNPHFIRYYAFRGYFNSGVYLLLLIAGIFVPAYARLVLLLMFSYPFMQPMYRWLNRILPA